MNIELDEKSKWKPYRWVSVFFVSTLLTSSLALYTYNDYDNLFSSSSDWCLLIEKALSGIRGNLPIAFVFTSLLTWLAVWWKRKFSQQKSRNSPESSGLGNDS